MVSAKLLEEVYLQVLTPHNLKARNAAKGSSPRPFGAAPTLARQPIRPSGSGGAVSLGLAPLKFPNVLPNRRPPRLALTPSTVKVFAFALCPLMLNVPKFPAGAVGTVPGVRRISV